MLTLLIELQDLIVSPRFPLNRSCTVNAATYRSSGEKSYKADRKFKRTFGAGIIFALSLKPACPTAIAIPEAGHLSVVPSGVTAASRRHHPGRGFPPDAPPSDARGRPAADCPGSFSPRNVRLGSLRPAIARGLGGDVRVTSVCLLRERHLCACAIRVQSPPPALSLLPFPRPSPRGTAVRPTLRHPAARVQPQGSHTAPLYPLRRRAPEPSVGGGSG